MSKRTVIIGVGNLLLGDEGIGIHVVEELSKRNLPANVEVIDGGTGGVALLSLMEGANKVIIVDAVLGGNSPGKIYVLDAERLMKGVVKFISLHEMDLLSTLMIGRELSKLPPELILVGVEPKNYQEYNMDLSPEVEAVIPKVIDVILGLI